MLIGPEHPRYVELFYGTFGAGQSYPARLVKNPPPAPDLTPLGRQPVRCPPSPSHEHQEDPRSDKS